MENKTQSKLHVIDVAAGRKKAEIVLKNAVYLNVFTGELLQGDIAICRGVIAGIGEYCGETEYDMTGKVVLPGFIDAHVHLESALVSPREFARAVLPHGTTTVVTDPHEIANVMGTDGIEYMLQATEGLPVDVRFMLPSCVPATPLEEAGAELDWRAIDGLYGHRRVLGLAEMMNYVGVIGGEKCVAEKLAAAQAHHKKIDGHAPGLTGKELDAYVAAGVYSDHECAELDDAVRKIQKGQYIMIREGTAARNLEALMGLLTPKYYERCMFCCDDKHPSDLLYKGHIDHICRRAVAMGADPVLVAKTATWNAARYFQLNDRGAVAPGYRADLAVVADLTQFRVEMVFKDGVLQTGKEIPEPRVDNRLRCLAGDTFRVAALTEDDFRDANPRGVIGMVPGEIITTMEGFASRVEIGKDILKMVVIERHKGTGHIGIGYLRGYGLKSGAVATSISHDSHNIICVGTNSRDMAFAVNQVVSQHGGIVVAEKETILANVVLDIAGIMSTGTLEEVNDALERAKTAAFSLGVSRDIDPFMTLSFMALPVIPQVRLTTRGVVDVATQQYL